MRSRNHPERPLGRWSGELKFGRIARTAGVIVAAAWVVTAVIKTPAAKINLVDQAEAATVSSRSTGLIVAPESSAVLGDLIAPKTLAAKKSAPAESTLKVLPADLLGNSGSLRAAFKTGVEPGMVQAAAAIGDFIKPITDFVFITPKPASAKRKGRIGLYYLGNWPSSRSTKGGKVAYTPPAGFIEVTRGNQTTQVSEHFRLRDFLTHDQQAVWPKYLALNLKLVDKLELVLQDLKEHGIDPGAVRVMSGFRTPQYNKRGGNPRGRASLSRHMYGDAADIYIDLAGTGQMSDLNGDGRVDIDDARVILAAVERVEREHPSLVGGAGVYAGTSEHGPFIHIDTRGSPARWVGTGD